MTVQKPLSFSCVQRHLVGVRASSSHHLHRLSGVGLGVHTAEEESEVCSRSQADSNRQAHTFRPLYKGQGVNRAGSLGPTDRYVITLGACPSI